MTEFSRAHLNWLKFALWAQLTIILPYFMNYKGSMHAKSWHLEGLISHFWNLTQVCPHYCLYFEFFMIFCYATKNLYFYCPCKTLNGITLISVCYCMHFVTFWRGNGACEVCWSVLYHIIVLTCLSLSVVFIGCIASNSYMVFRDFIAYCYILVVII